MTRPPELPDSASLLRELGWLRRFAAGLVGGGAAGDADDIAQETLLRALQARPDARAGGFRPWLRTVARHVVRTAARRRRRERPLEEPERLPHATGLDAADLAARAELHRRLVDAVLAQREPYRSVLLARFLDERPAAEIAARLGVPLETVRTRIRRGLERVRHAMDRQHGGRAAWMVPLAAGLRLGPAAGPAVAAGAGTAPLPAGGAAGAAGLTLGVFSMSKSTFLSLAAAAAVVAVLAVALLRDPWGLPATPADPVPHPDVVRAADAPGAAPPGLEARADGGAQPAERVAVEDAASAGAEPVAASAWALAGRVETEVAGDPVQGASVRLVRDATVVGQAEDVLAETITDAAGGFSWSLSDPAPVRTLQSGRGGRFRVMVAAPDRALRSLRLGEIPRDPEGRLRILSPRGARVHGRVVREAGGPGVAGATLLVTSGNWIHVVGDRGVLRVLDLGGLRPVGRSEGGGRFVLRDRIVADGDREPALVAHHPERGLGWARITDLPRGGGEVEVDVVLHPVAELEVTVRDADGTVCEGIEVRAQPASAPLGADFTFTAGALDGPWRATTDARGRARLLLPQVPATGSRLEAACRWGLRVAPGSPREQRVLVDFAADAASQRHTRDVVLADVEPLRVEGRVSVRGAADRPVAGARVSLATPFERRQQKVDADGGFAFELEDGVGAGPLVLEAEAEGFVGRPAVFAHVTKDDGVFRRDLALDPAAGGPEVPRPDNLLTVYLQTLDGHPAEVASVWIQRVSSADGREVDDGGERLHRGGYGRVLFHDLLPGVWRVRVEPGAGRPEVCSELRVEEAESGGARRHRHLEHRVVVGGGRRFEVELRFEGPDPPDRVRIGTGMMGGKAMLAPADASRPPADRELVLTADDPRFVALVGEGVVASVETRTGSWSGALILDPAREARERIVWTLRPAGRIVLERGRPEPGAVVPDFHVRLQEPGADWIRFVGARPAAGRTAGLPMPAGRYEWRLVGEGGDGDVLRTGTVGVPPGGEAVVDLR